MPNVQNAKAKRDCETHKTSGPMNFSGSENKRNFEFCYARNLMGFVRKFCHVAIFKKIKFLRFLKI